MATFRGRNPSRTPRRGIRQWGAYELIQYHHNHDRAAAVPTECSHLVLITGMSEKEKDGGALPSFSLCGTNKKRGASAVQS
jgi:hypothetical protein